MGELNVEGAEERGKGGTMGGTTSSQCRLMGHMETYYCRSFLQYTCRRKKSKWSLQITGETKSQLNILFLHMKIPVPGMGSIYLSRWPKRYRGNPQTIRATAKADGCSPQSDGMVLLLKTLLTYLIRSS